MSYREFKEISDPVDLEGYAQVSPLSISGSAAQTAILPEGRYDIWSDVDCWVKIADTANDVTSTTGYKLFAGNVVTVIVRLNRKIGAITGGSSGTLSAHKVG